MADEKKNAQTSAGDKDVLDQWGSGTDPIGGPAPTPKRRKGPIVALVIVVAVVVLCIGGYAWHSTPSFCGTVCHNTMYEHLANYEDGPGLAKVHADKDGMGCLDCHEADIETQASEAYAQVTGTYGNLDLASRYYVDNDKCLSCHGGSYEALAEQTSDLGEYNPHDNPHGQMNCNECHKGHASQVNLCDECHTNGGQQMQA